MYKTNYKQQDFFQTIKIKNNGTKHFIKNQCERH